MELAIIGLGNVGSALVTYAALNPRIERIALIGRSSVVGEATAMDVMSALPDHGRKLVVGAPERVADADIVVLTSGVLLGAAGGIPEMLAINEQIAVTSLGQYPLKRTAVVIMVSSPVDDVTPLAQRITSLPRSQVIGFGGDLDRNRLIAVLRARGIDSRDAMIVGEHGPRAIPVYPSEADYDAVAHAVRNYLGAIKDKAGKPRNLASGFLLAELIETILSGRGQVHFVCGFHPEHARYLTWPFLIGAAGILGPAPIKLGPHAEAALASLLPLRGRDTRDIVVP